MLQDNRSVNHNISRVWNINMIEKLNIEIRNYWLDVKATLPEEIIKNFSNLTEPELENYIPGIGLSICGSIIKPDSELYNLFTESGIESKDEMIAYTIREWHYALHEDNKITLNEALKEKILNLWPLIKKDIFKDDAVLLEFIKTQVNKLNQYHFGKGTYLRNTFIYPNDEFRRQFIENGIEQPDDMSSAMIRILHKALRDGTI